MPGKLGKCVRLEVWEVMTWRPTVLEIEGEHHIRPVTWDEWITLPIGPQEKAVQTVRGPVRAPTVIVAVRHVLAL